MEIKPKKLPSGIFSSSTENMVYRIYNYTVGCFFLHSDFAKIEFKKFVKTCLLDDQTEYVK